MPREERKMHLWRVTMRFLSTSQSDRKSFDYLIANYETSEKKAVDWFRENWGTPEWWACALLQNITYVDELHLNAAVIDAEKEVPHA
jgi:hypothetical protein